MTSEDQALQTVDQAMFQLRRHWAKPHLIHQLRDSSTADRPIQVSNLLVVNAVGRLRAETEGGVTVGAVAERLDVDPSTASRLVGHAVEAGFVSRKPSPLDARRANLELTETGERVKAATEHSRRDYVARLMADWTDAERAEFARLLRRFTDAAMRTPRDPVGAEMIYEAARSRR